MATDLQQISSPETDVWKNAVNGDTNAFESIVVSHQSAVSAVAFSIVGDFSISQDIAQETFWAAWKSKDSLRDANRLGAWLCGIARNLARQWRRKKSRTQEVATDKFGSDFDSLTTSPHDEFVSKEEEAVVWSALDEIPENYREVLVLYYRKGQSIDDVANSLGITNAAARQRLARGRDMLRSRVSNMIEGVLDRTNPSRSFTARVMAGIVSAGVVGNSTTANASVAMALNSSTATSAASVAKLLASGSVTGMIGGFLGAGVGLLGAWFGTWWPAQMAPTETERHLLLERGRIMMNASLAFTLIFVSLSVTYVIAPDLWKPVFLLSSGTVIAFAVFAIVNGIKTQMLVKQLRRELTTEEDPNRSPFGAKLRAKAVSHKQIYGRKFTSKASFLGFPLVDIQVSDPRTSETDEERQTTRPAKGWIAIGDVATGFIAIGGRTLGVFSVGGAAMGVVAIGGLSLGLLSLGGAALGFISFGGAAIGFDAVGGAAIGWHSAVGGGAVAWNVAMGGAAIANDFAVGGSAIANEANTDLARQMVDENSFAWFIKNNWFANAAILFSIAIGAFSSQVSKLFYTNEPTCGK